jgi:hypothetical protein
VSKQGSFVTEIVSHWALHTLEPVGKVMPGVHVGKVARCQALSLSHLAGNECQQD